MGRIIEKWQHIQERGSAVILALVSLAVLAMLGSAFALMVQNEAKESARGTAYDQALLVAEAGVQDVLYQRSKKAESLCFPFDSQGGADDYGVVAGVIGAGAQAKAGSDPANVMCGGGACGACENDYIPCWPYNEKLYLNKITYGPQHECHDGSADCPGYAPLASWPAGPGGSAIGWKDMEAQRGTPLVNRSSSSGQRYTTGFFALCNDDCVGDSPNPKCCASPPCKQHVLRLSVVSVGEVDISPNKSVRRAVKVDILPSALYSGLIDKFVDISGMYSANINGSVHINGWKNAANDDIAIEAYLSLSALFAFLDPPEMISVSYPEPTLPKTDWQPGDLGLPALFGEITWIHLPVRLEIPEVQWEKWERRMIQLYRLSAAYYPGQVKMLRSYEAGTNCRPNGDQDADSCDPSLNPFDSQLFLKFNCPPNADDTGRIHNCRRTSYTNWSGGVAFDKYDGGSPRSGAPNPIAQFQIAGVQTQVATNDQDGSLGYVDRKYFKIGLNPGCGFSNLMACLQITKHRPEFQFMGRHDFRDIVFIDGTILMTNRTPYHTCGTDECDGPGFCLQFPYCFKLGSIAGFDIEFGVPHWHLGETRIYGEVLVNGELYMGDWVRILGGAVYAADSVTKDEASGIDLNLNIVDLLCYFVPSITIFGFDVNICSLLFAVLDPIIKVFLPWWPNIDLTNNGLWDNKTYLDIDGAQQGFNDKNPGSLFTRGDFSMGVPETEVTGAIINFLVSLLPGISTKPSIDPVRLYGFGALVAAGRVIGGQLYGGNINIGGANRSDIMTCKPNSDGDLCTTGSNNGWTDSIGYAFARGELQVTSDIISHYGMVGLIDNCTSVNNPMDMLSAGCAAAGIYYSKGEPGIRQTWDCVTGNSPPCVRTNTQETKIRMFTSSGCANPDIQSSGYWNDILGETMCWARSIPYLCGILGGNCESSEFNIRGHVFAGAVGGMPKTTLRLDQDPSVRHAAVTRSYFQSFGGTPIDWMEIEPPSGLPALP